MNSSTTKQSKRSPFVMALFVLLGIIAILLLCGFLLYRYYFHAKTHKPVELNQKEKIVLQEKLEVLDVSDTVVPVGASETTSTELQRPKGEIDEYLEDDKRPIEEQRKIRLTEREANALLNKNTDLAEKVKIKFEKDMIRIALVFPLDEDLPIIGGKTFRGKAYIKAFMRDGRMSLIIDEIYAQGFPIPKAWADFKDVDLVSDPDKSSPFFEKLAEGIKDFKIENGEVVLELNE